MEKYKVIFVISLFCIACSFSACCKKDKDPYFESFFPLKIGNTWIYEESYFYPSTSDTPLSVRQIQVKITKDTIIEDNQLAYIVEETRENYTRRFLWYEKGDDFIEQQVNGSKIIKYKLSMEKESTWDMFPGFPNQEFNIKKVTSVFESYEFLQTSAFAYEIRYGNAKLNDQGQNGELSSEIFAPGIGVLESNYQINYYGPSRTRTILTDYYTN